MEEARHFDLQNPDNLAKIDTLAAAQYKAGHFADAEELLKQALVARKRILGEEHADTLQTMNNLAAVGISTIFFCCGTH